MIQPLFQSCHNSFISIAPSKPKLFVRCKKENSDIIYFLNLEIAIFFLDWTEFQLKSGSLLLAT